MSTTNYPLGEKVYEIMSAFNQKQEWDKHLHLSAEDAFKTQLDKNPKIAVIDMGLKYHTGMPVEEVLSPVTKILEATRKLPNGKFQLLDFVDGGESVTSYGIFTELTDEEIIAASYQAAMDLDTKARVHRKPSFYAALGLKAPQQFDR